MKATRSSPTRWLAIAAGAGLLATLGGCVVAPIGPHRAYGPPVAYGPPIYVGPPGAVVVQPAPPPPRYYGGGAWRYRGWR